jgi:hypothetical protein
VPVLRTPRRPESARRRTLVRSVAQARPTEQTRVRRQC